MTDVTDPQRLAAASDEVGQLLRAAERDLPSAEALGRVATRLGPVLNAGSAAGVSLGAKLALLALGVAAVTGVGVWATQRAPQAVAPHHVAPPAQAPAEPRSAPPASGPSIPPEATATSSAPSVEAAPVPEAAAASSAGSASRSATSEARLLADAQAALRSDPARALALAREHQRSYPRGALSQERDVIMIDALRRLGRAGEARDRAQRFGERYPGSAYGRKVKGTADGG